MIIERSGILFMIAVLLLSSTGCHERIEYDPNEVLVTINTGNWPDYDQRIFYVIVENKRSGSVFAKLVKGEDCHMRRGEVISGDLINLHFFALGGHNNDYNLYSYYDILPGKVINMSYIFFSGRTTVVPGKRVGNITFSDVPAFDIVTRSANNPRHCHTLNTLNVPCAMPGRDSYEGKYFYVCIQKGDDAGYKLVEIPGGSEYDLSLGDLNYNMTKYSIPKDPAMLQIIRVMAYGSDGMMGIYALYDETLFSGNNIDVFVPVGLTQMTSFHTTVEKSESDKYQASYYVSSTVTTAFSYLDAGLSIKHTSGKLPIITHNGDKFDWLETTIRFADTRSWMLCHPSGQSLYLPEFPSEVLQAISADFQISSKLSDISSIVVTAIEDSRLNSYDEVFESAMRIITLPDQEYSILRDNCRIGP